MKTKSQQTHAPNCQHCSEQMKYAKVTDKNMALQLVGLLFFLIGLGLTVVAFPFGAIVGLIVIIVAARLGYRKVWGWKCGNCGYFFAAKRT